MTVDEFKQLSNLLERVIHKYIQSEKKPMDYGCGVKLTRTEIHTIALLKQNPGISVTAVAQKRGITKGAASQMIYKMVDKGMVEKQVSPNSDAQVSLYLTPVGEKASEMHDAYHKNNVQPIYKYFNTLSEDTVNALIGIMKVFEQSMDEQMNRSDEQGKIPEEKK